MSYADDIGVQAARSSADALGGQVASETTPTMTLPDMLRDALTKKFSTDNPLYKEREGALKTYMDSTTQGPLNVTPRSAGGLSDVVYNPEQQANLIQQTRSGPLAHLFTINDLIGLGTGGMGNVIDATGRVANANLQGLIARANLARQHYQDVLGEAQARFQEEMARQAAAFEQTKFNTTSGQEQQRIDMEKARAGTATSGGIRPITLPGIKPTSAPPPPPSYFKPGPPLNVSVNSQGKINPIAGLKFLS